MATPTALTNLLTADNAAIGLNLASIIANGSNPQQGGASNPLMGLMGSGLGGQLMKGLGAGSAAPANADGQPTDAFQNNTAYLNNQATKASPLGSTNQMNPMLQNLLMYRMSNGGLL